MAEELDDIMKAAGGRKSVLFGTDPDDPANVTWNFGLQEATPAGVAVMQAKPTFHARFPKLVGKWDGKTTINHLDACRKVLGDDKVTDLIHYQPRGSCGGRSGAGATDVLQCIMIASGKRQKFKRVSHAALYYFARKRYGMLKGNWQNDDLDGVPSGSIPEAMVKDGLCTREETGDEKWYGAGSDDLACQLGAGLQKDLARKIDELAKDNLVTEWAPVKSAAEAADGIAAGGVLIGSDSRGFSMSRDNEGCCSPRGTWYHYHFRPSINVLPSGRKVFGYFQSWGKTTPSGPKLAGHTGNCFGVDWGVQDQCIRSGAYAVIFGFDPFELEEDKVDVTWTF